MIFTLNVGNTHTSLHGWPPGKALWRAQWRTNTAVPLTVLKKLRAHAGALLVAASVVPDAWRRIQRKLSPFKLNIVSLRDALRYDLTVVPKPSRRVGEDRLAAAFGAAFLDLKKSWVVVDCGTAMTVNAVRNPGRGPLRFEGGVIIPGAGLALRALTAGTAQLPALSAPLKYNAKRAIGRSTIQALQLGVLHAALGSAVHLARLQQRELGGACGVALTGGLSRDTGFARAFASSFPHGVVRVEPDLVHKGLFAASLAVQLGRRASRAKPR